jgi:hypothetical protein
MDRATLLALDKELLVDLILQLQATVARLEARLAEVEAELSAQRPPPKTPTNSSVPPSQGF